MYKEYFTEHFKEIEDTRFLPYVEHQLTDVLIIVMSGILCGLDELQDIVTYGKSNATFFRETFGIERTPSKSTLTRIMNLIDGEAVAAIIVNIMREAIGTSGDVIAFDGKTEKQSALQQKGIVRSYI